MTTSSDAKQYAFQAEIQQLLQLLSHSLYQNREIAIRELVSNASDALDKLRHVSLTDKSVSADKLEIRIEPDKDARVLVIRDNGIGMTEDDLVNNLGTIAHSGSAEFLSKLKPGEKADVSLIGQFGVGFYSAFMLADTVEVVTRRQGTEEGFRWESDGSGNFSIQPAEDVEPGTQIRLHLKEDLDEFTDTTRLKFILTRYSTFVPHPILLDSEHINDQPPIWVEPKSSLSDEQYENFYQYLAHMPNAKPLWHLHMSADSPFQFYSILYCPEQNFENLGFGRMEHGLNLCAKRILVQNDNRDLLPEYLRFLHGLVDSADLPLNVSREALQDNTVFRKMRKVIVKKVLDHLGKLSKDDSEKFETFYRQFGSVLREGVSTDFENRERIAKLLRFGSSHSAVADALVSLDEYIERAPEDQKQIYFLGGMDRESMERNPALEIFRKKKLEVLFLTDAADEFVLSQLGRYEDYDIKSVDAADIELPGEPKKDDAADEETDDKKKDETAEPTALDKVISLIADELGDAVDSVRKSERLTDSSCCVVNPQGGMSTQMQKVLQINSPEFQMQKLIFELNPDAPLVKRMCELSTNSDNDAFIKSCGSQLYANALVIAGLAPPADEMSRRVEGFMQELAASRSSIVQ